jgi:hypothetical protein
MATPTAAPSLTIAKGEATLRLWRLRRQARAVSGSLSERIAARQGSTAHQGERKPPRSCLSRLA